MNDEERSGALALYMSMLEVVHVNGNLPRGHHKRRDSVRFGKEMEDVSRERAWSKRLHASLKEARLVQVPSPLYTRFYTQWDKRLSEDCGVPWKPWRGFLSPPSRRVMDKAQLDIGRIKKHTAEEMRRVPFPERLPFSSTILVFSEPIIVPTESMLLKLGADAARRIRHIQLHAIHVTDCGICVEWMSGMDTMSENPFVPTIFNVAHSANGSWIMPETTMGMDLTPGVVSDLIGHIGGFVDIRVPSGFPKDVKRDWRLKRDRIGTRRGEPPPDFYPYILRSSVRTEGGDGPGSIREPMSYRTDVMAHERLLVRRGSLPLPPKKYEYYIKNGFKVFSDAELTDDLKKKLQVKGHRLKDRSEWMAVKSVWIKQHMNSNDESLPYRQKLTIAPEKRTG